MPFTIRPEQDADASAILELTTLAFSASEWGYHGEAEIVDRLRTRCPQIVSLVAEENGRIVGHILFSPVQIIGEGQTWEGMGLAPLSVLPERQNRGIGSRLVESGLEHLAACHCSFVVVLGHPEYYAPFGFEPALRFGITCEFPGIPEDVFRIKVLSIDAVDLPKGTAKYREEFSLTE